MADISIFDLLHPAQTPQENDLRTWIKTIFPQATDKSAFQLVMQLEKLFEVSIFENRIEDAHMLLQQGVPPDLCWDWKLTPLMCTNYLGYEKLSDLLIAYGANSQAKSFSGKTAAEFKNLSMEDPSEECTAILTRYAEIRNQTISGLLKSCAETLTNNKKTASTTTSKQKITSSPAAKIRQIDNGKGVDEIFKHISKPTG